MYSVQHVLWRGVMALSLLVVGGVGAGVTTQSVPAGQDALACEDAAFVFHGVRGAVKSEFAIVPGAQPPLQIFDTIVVKGIPPKPEKA